VGQDLNGACPLVEMDASIPRICLWEKEKNNFCAKKINKEIFL
jgi:hypothetical protein